MTVIALRGHRPEVLGDLLERYGREIQGLAYLILRDRDAAEDVLTDTLLAALEHGHTLRDEGALRPWLLRIAVNRALAVRRTNARIVTLAVIPDVADQGDDVDERLTLLAAVERLAPRTRAAVVLRYYVDLSLRDVAVALGTSENTVKTQLREALGQMRKTLRVAPADDPRTSEVLHG